MPAGQADLGVGDLRIRSHTLVRVSSRQIKPRLLHCIGGSMSDAFAKRERPLVSAACLKRVAQAICKSRTCRGVSCCRWPANGGERHKCPVDKGNYDDAAFDAIAAFLDDATERELARRDG